MISLLHILWRTRVAPISDALQIVYDIMPLNIQVLNDNELFIHYLHPLILG